MSDDLFDALLGGSLDDVARALANRDNVAE